MLTIDQSVVGPRSHCRQSGAEMLEDRIQGQGPHTLPKRNHPTAIAGVSSVPQWLSSGAFRHQSGPSVNELWRCAPRHDTGAKQATLPTWSPLCPLRRICQPEAAAAAGTVPCRDSTPTPVASAAGFPARFWRQSGGTTASNAGPTSRLSPSLRSASPGCGKMPAAYPATEPRSPRSLTSSAKMVLGSTVQAQDENVRAERARASEGNMRRHNLVFAFPSAPARSLNSASL